MYDRFCGDQTINVYCSLEHHLILINVLASVVAVPKFSFMVGYGRFLGITSVSDSVLFVRITCR